MSTNTMRRGRKQLVSLWILAFGLLLLGVYLSAIQFLGREWLSRAGCLVVVIGLWSSIGGIIQERLLLSRLQMHRRLANSHARRRLRREKASTELIDQELADIAQRFDAQADAIQQDLKLSVGILEVSLLMAGTLFWGFGDLVKLLW